MLENKGAAVQQAERSFNSLLQTRNSFVWLQDTPFFRLCTMAATNSINVILQDSQSSLLQSKLLLLVCTLCQMIINYTRQTYNRGFLEGRYELKGTELDKLQMEITAAGDCQSVILLVQIHQPNDLVWTQSTCSNSVHA